MNQIKREEYIQLVCAVITGTSQRPERQIYTAYDVENLAREAMQGIEQALMCSNIQIVTDLE